MLGFFPREGDFRVDARLSSDRCRSARVFLLFLVGLNCSIVPHRVRCLLYDALRSIFPLCRDFPQTPLASRVFFGLILTGGGGALSTLNKPPIVSPAVLLYM